jgi:hypothetical protein
VLLIGNELLSGKIRDQNGHNLAKMMRRRGIRLLEVCTVEDDLSAIGDALLRLLARTPLVFTSGGVGPTHDDVTMEALARALAAPPARPGDGAPAADPLRRPHHPRRPQDGRAPAGHRTHRRHGWPVMRATPR